jgi:hypothetical protein
VLPETPNCPGNASPHSKTPVRAPGLEVLWRVSWRPPAGVSRVSAYDGFGTLTLAPLGAAITSPLATSLGTTTVLAADAILIILLTAAIVSVPEIRNIHRREPTRLTPPATEPT